MVKTALDYSDGPIAMRYPRGNGLGVPMDDTLQAIPIGSWEILREGNDAAILTFGTTIPMALQAAEALAVRGVDVKVVNARFIKPLDNKLLDELFATGMPIMTVEEAVLAGGFGSAVIEYAHDTYRKGVPIRRMGIPDQFIEHGNVDELLAEIGMTAGHLADNLQMFVEEFAVKREQV